MRDPVLLPTLLRHVTMRGETLVEVECECEWSATGIRVASLAARDITLPLHEPIVLLFLAKDGSRSQSFGPFTLTSGHQLFHLSCDPRPKPPESLPLPAYD